MASMYMNLFVLLAFVVVWAVCQDNATTAASAAATTAATTTASAGVTVAASTAVTNDIVKLITALPLGLYEACKTSVESMHSLMGSFFGTFKPK